MRVLKPLMSSCVSQWRHAQAQNSPLARNSRTAMSEARRRRIRPLMSKRLGVSLKDLLNLLMTIPAIKPPVLLQGWESVGPHGLFATVSQAPGDGKSQQKNPYDRSPPLNASPSLYVKKSRPAGRLGAESSGSKSGGFQESSLSMHPPLPHSQMTQHRAGTRKLAELSISLPHSASSYHGGAMKRTAVYLYPLLESACKSLRSSTAVP